MGRQISGDARCSVTVANRLHLGQRHSHAITLTTCKDFFLPPKEAFRQPYNRPQGETGSLDIERAAPGAPSTSAVTALLRRSREGDKQAFDELVPFVHQQLERLASACLRSARKDQTIRTTALVNEAYLKLAGSDATWADRSHFFAVATRAMRQILVDNARLRNRGKRGGGALRVTLDEAALISEPRAELLAIDEVLTQLEQFDPRKSKIIELIYFGGLTPAEAAESLGISEATLFRDLKLAKAWMHQRLQSTP